MRWVVDIDARHIECSRCVKMIDRGLDTVGVAAPVEIEVLRQELVGPRVTADDSSLPCEIVGDESALELGKGGGQAGVDGAVDGGEIGPVIDAVAPVVEAKLLVHRGEIGVSLPHPLHKGRLHVRAAGVVGFGFVVELIADDGGVVLHMIDQRNDDLLGCGAEGGIGDVHVLATAVFGGAFRRDDEDVRMLARQPCGNGIGWRSDDDPDACFIHRGEDAVDVAEIEDARFRFKCAPCGFRDAHDGDAGSFHHANVFVQPIVRGVLLVVGGTEEDCLRSFC